MISSPTKISLHDAQIIPSLRRCPLHNLPTLIQNNNDIAQVHHEVHIVLHKEHRLS